MRKGVSPLIGMTMLIAIVVATAFLFGQWVQPFTQQQTDVVENESERFHQCVDTHLRILDTATSQRSATVTLMNAGFQHLSTVNVVILGAGQAINSTTVIDVSSSEIRTVRIGTGDTQPERVVVIPGICPQMSVEEELSP